MTLTVVLVLVLAPITGGLLIGCMLHPRQGSRGHRRWITASALALTAFVGSAVSFLASFEASR